MSELLQIIQKLLAAGKPRAARRVEQAADEVPDLLKQFRPATIESIAQDQLPIASIDPRKFEDYASKLPGWYTNQFAGLTDETEKWPLVRDLANTGAPQYTDVPYLSITRQLPMFNSRGAMRQTGEEVGLPRIDSHEGRHRMRALSGFADSTYDAPTSLLRIEPRSPGLAREWRELRPDWEEKLDTSLRWLEQNQQLLPQDAKRQDRRLMNPNIFKPFADGGITKRGIKAIVNARIEAMLGGKMADGGTAGFDPEGEGYDIDAARAAGMRPDRNRHMGSVAPTAERDIYRMLKGRAHPTWDKGVAGENMRGSEVVKRDDGRYYSVPYAPGGGYADGGLAHFKDGGRDWTDEEIASMTHERPVDATPADPYGVPDAAASALAFIPHPAFMGPAAAYLAAREMQKGNIIGGLGYGTMPFAGKAAAAIGGATMMMEPGAAEASPLKELLTKGRAAVDARLPKGTFSPAARAIESAPQDMTGAQWRNFLRGRQVDVAGQKFPVRPDELEFTGMDALLQEYGEKRASRGALLDFLSGRHPGEKFPGEYRQLNLAATKRPLGDEEGERWAELIRTEPASHATYPYTQTFADNDKLPPSKRVNYPEHQLPGPREGYTEELTMMPGLGYKAPHFGAQGENLVSHSRLSTRPLPDGGKAVHIDEIQSDLHQKARDIGGYADPTKAARVQQLSKALTAARNEYKRLSDDEHRSLAREFSRIYDEQGLRGMPKEQIDQNPVVLDYRKRYDDLLAQELQARERYLQLETEYAAAQKESPYGLPPRAPYEDRYHEVEFNKALRRAVDEDADVVTWTTGDQQAKRWNQQIQGGVKKLELVPNGREKFDLLIEQPSGGTMEMRQRADGKFVREDGRGEAATLEELLGNSLAKKLKDQGVLEGENLSIGGGGFKNFYDGTINKYAESWARRFPGAKVEPAQLPGNASRGESARSLVSSVLREHDYDLTHAEDMRIAAGTPAIKNYVQALLQSDATTPDDLLHLRTVAEEVLDRMHVYPLDADRFLSSLEKAVDGRRRTMQVHSLRLTPEMKAWIKQHGTPIMGVAGAGVVGSETLDRIDALLGNTR